MKEKHKIYIFSVLNHSVVAVVAYLILYLVELAWPRYSSPSWLVYSFLGYWGGGFVVLPFLNPYEPVYRYFFKADREKKQSDR